MANSQIIEPKVLLPVQGKLSFSERLTSLLNRWQPSPDLIFLISAFFIGVGSGLAIVFFRYLIGLCETLTFKNFMGGISIFGFWTVAFIPAIGGLIVGIMRWFFPQALGENLSSLISRKGTAKIAPLRPFIKMVAAAISLGTGASLGSESPSVEIGSNIGILFGQNFQVSQERYRLLLGAGAAAGLAAAFHTPIAGVFFALEVILGTTFVSPSLSLILLSAVFSDVISRFFLGDIQIFILPEYHFISYWQVIFYIGLGLVATPICLAYTQSIRIAQALFSGEYRGFIWLGNLPPFLKPAFGGILVGLAALQLPEILGVGYGTLATILDGREFSSSKLLLLLSVKLVVTAISLGSGFVGGVFAPALFIGGCLGALYANLLQIILPPTLAAIAPSPAVAAMVGMAAVLAGSVKAPLTAIIMIFELIGNYKIILPLMAAVGMCIWVVEQIKSIQSVEGLKLEEMGINVESPNEIAILQNISVATIMETTYLTLADSTGLLEAGRKMIEHKYYTALVKDKSDDLVGIVTLGDLKRILREIKNQPDTFLESNPQISELCTREIIYAYQSQSVAETLKQMTARDIYLLPVVAPDNHRQVIGVVEKNRIKLARELAETEEALNNLEFRI